jgi:hypothetical protein
MGHVYRAHDSQLQRDVALKTLYDVAPEDVYQLKREFRTLASFSHRHVVQLYELFADDHGCFFTMELLEGESLLDHLRSGMVRGAALEEASSKELRRRFGELVDGLRTLHEAGQVHRDVKPSNVMVTPKAGAVLLDFGLTTAGREVVELEPGVLAGTVAYASPEQAWGSAPDPSADWYSLGATLYEALCGAPPYEGSAAHIISAKRLGAPPPPSTVAAAVPRGLDELCTALMAKAPGERPSPDDILATLSEEGAERATRVAHSPAMLAPDEIPFIGRAEPHARLDRDRERSRRGPCVSFVRGRSGIGKSELVRRFAESQRDAGALVLSGRCRLQESVAYRAMDPLIDELSRFLVGLPDDQIQPLVPRYCDVLLRLFPVLARVPALSLASEPLAASDDELVRRGFVALRELLSNIARERPLVFWIDDAQWGDRGSVALLRSVLRPPDAPSLHLVLSYRSEDGESSPLLAGLRESNLGDGVAESLIELGPLGEEHARELIDSLLDDRSPLSDEEIGQVIAEAGGSPFFILELIHLLRHEPAGLVGTPDLDRVVEARLSPLSSDSRAVLDLVAVGGRPLSAHFILDLAGVGPGGRPLVLDLCARSLLRTGGPEASLIETYHDRIRETVVGAIPADELRLRHRQLADGLRAEPRPNPAALTEHYLGAGEDALAAEFAVKAAAEAEAALAFDRAADFYALALRLRGTADVDWEMHERQAMALANAGRGAESGEAFVEASAAMGRVAPDAHEQALLVGSAAEQYLYAGHSEVGLEHARAVMAHFGVSIPDSAPAAMRAATMLRLRFMLFQRRPTADSSLRVPRDARDRLTALFGSSKGTALYYPKISDYLGLHYLSDALRSRDPEHVAISVAKEASIESALPGAFWRRRATRLLTRAREIGELSGKPHVTATVDTCWSARNYFAGEWKASVEEAERAIETFRSECIGEQQSVSITLNFLIPALAELGEIGRLRELLPEFLEEARRRGDLTVSTVLESGRAVVVALARDDAEAAIEAANRLWDTPATMQESTAHMQYVLGMVQTNFYQDEPERAWQHVESAWSAMRSGGFLTFEAVAVMLRHARAAAAIACAARGGVGDWTTSRLLKDAASQLRALSRSKLPHAMPATSTLRAALAGLEGDAKAERLHLEHALRGFCAADMALHAALCRLHVAHRGGEDASAAEHWLAEQGVACADAMAASVLPGVRWLA